MKQVNSVVRTIKNGQVKINGKWFAPEAIYQEYAGELDDLRYVFGLYYTANQWDDQFVSLIGSEANCRETGMVYGAEVQNGTLPWLFWKPANPGASA